MLYSQSPPLADNDAARQSSSRGFARDQEARSEPRFGGAPASASIHTLPRPRTRPSVGRRMLRAVSRFVMAVFIGVGATLGWQAYGDTAKQMLAVHAPELVPLLAWLPAKSPPAVAAAPASPTLQLEPLAANLEFVRRSVEQMAIKQEQIIRNVAALQAIDEEIRQKVSSPPPAPPQPAAAVPPPKPAAPKLQPPAGAPRPSASAAPVSLAPR